QRLSILYHDTKGVTDSTYRVQYDALWLQLLAVDTLPPLVTSVFTVVGMVLVMLVLDWELALIAVAVAPFMLLFTFVYRQRLRSGTGTLTLGGLLIVNYYLTQIYGPLRDVGRRIIDVQKAFAGMDRFLEILDEEPDVKEAPNALQLTRANGRVVFEDVSFSYQQ